MKKVCGSAAEALDGVLHDGMLIAAGGFGLCGITDTGLRIHECAPGVTREEIVVVTEGAII